MPSKGRVPKMGVFTNKIFFSKMAKKRRIAIDIGRRLLTAEADCHAERNSVSHS